MEYCIVNESPKRIRAVARQALRGEWIGAVLVMILNYLVSDLPYLIVSSLTESEFMITAAALYSYIVAGPLSLGLAFYFIKVFRMEEHPKKLLFHGFKHFRNAMGVYVFMLAKIFLWSLLFIIPGIIASFRYSLSFFILADDPEKDPLRCLAESDVIMRGNKTNLLILLASFIGWYLLASLPSLIIENQANFSFPVTRESVRAILDTVMLGPVKPAGVLAGAGKLLVQAYMYAAEVCFYDLAVGNLLIKSSEEAHEI